MKIQCAGMLVLVLALTNGVFAQEINDLETVRGMAAAGDREAALEQLHRLIEADTNNVQARFLKGMLELDQGDTGAARETFADIARLFPRLPEAFNNLAAIYAMDGEYERARQTLLSAVANSPDYAVARSNLADLYVRLAVDAYRKAVELDPDDPVANARLELLEQLFDSGT
jgi:tetratricopeptide (TPR) repeat protein